MTSKIRIKIGDIELEYEGEEDFFKKEFPGILTATWKLYREIGPPKPTGPAAPANGPNVQPSSQGPVGGTTATFAAHLGCKTGPDLVLAAGARLTFVLNKETFDKKELLREMQSASSYYRKTYGSNLGAYVGRLVKKQKLVERAKGTYALHAGTRSEMEGTLATQR